MKEQGVPAYLTREGDGEARLAYFKALYSRESEAWEGECRKMEEREALYRGEGEVRPVCYADEGPVPAFARRNIVSELVEALIDPGIPSPRVRAIEKGDEPYAAAGEAFLRAAGEYLPLAEVNDLAERIVRVQGGVFYLVEYDPPAEKAGRFPVRLSALHPSAVVPQSGVFSSVEDMDYFFLRRDVPPPFSPPEGEEDGSSSFFDRAPNKRLQISCYYRNSRGGVGLFVWSDDAVLLDLPDCQERKRTVCAACGRPAAGREKCVCGSGDFILEPLAFSPLDGDPYPVPGLYPLVLQKNVSVPGRLLGESDVDRLASAQNTVNRVENLICERLVTGGTYMTLPSGTEIEVNTRAGKEIRLDSPADKAMFGSVDMQGDVGPALSYLAVVYEEARQAVGVTDSYQGRTDDTASSGTAKKFAASQTETRLESRKVMKRAAYAAVYERIFRLCLAYLDRPLAFGSGDGASTFSPKDFLRVEGGRKSYRDRFLFGCDEGAGLSGNREKLYSEIRAAFSDGALGEGEEARRVFWELLKSAGHPLAGMALRLMREEGEKSLA